jgi:CO/xanthine dehydrogenase Mo-binding subunit
MIYGLTIRSPVAKGRLKSIEFPELPENYILLCAKDIPGKNRLEETEIPILAEDRLSYIGEPAAILFGPDKSKLKEYATQCRVIAEDEEPVFFNSGSGGEILAERELKKGDPEGAFARAAKTVQCDYHSGIQEHWYSEPVGAVTWYESEPETLVVRTATQWPCHVKRSIVQALNIEPSRVFINPTTTGCHMDGKLWYPSLVACHAALGTLITKKPVRLILTKEEDFFYSPKRCETVINIAGALDEDGNLLGCRINISVNLGAHAVNGDEIIDQSSLGSLGIYQFDNFILNAKAYRTNIPPQGPFSGFGLAQGSFAIERHVSHIADQQKKDPAQWRKEHSKGFFADSEVPGKLLDTAAIMSDYSRKWASYELLRQSRKDEPKSSETLRGIGISLGFQGNGLIYPDPDTENYGIEVTLSKSGELEINTNMVSPEDGFSGIWAGIASNILSIEPGMVHIINTSSSPDSGPRCASRNIVTITSLVEQCCLTIGKQRFKDPLPITVRQFAEPESVEKWEEFFPPLEGKKLDLNGFLRPGMAAAVVEIEIEEAGFIPKIRGVWMAVNGGKILSLNRARQAIILGITQSLGWSFREHLSYRGGSITKNQYNYYSIPGLGDIPPIFIDFIQGMSEKPKGIGELPFNCVPAAYLQAVSQAMDYHFSTIPLTREELWNAVKSKSTEAQP